jgi:hypothetical protein
MGLQILRIQSRPWSEEDWCRPGQNFEASKISTSGVLLTVGAKKNRPKAAFSLQDHGIHVTMPHKTANTTGDPHDSFKLQMESRLRNQYRNP